MPIPARSLGQTFAKHRSLQVIADPLYWRQSAVQPSIAGIMQPADFDITANMLETFLKKACGNSMFSRPPRGHLHPVGRHRGGAPRCA